MPTTSATNPEYIMKVMKEQLDAGFDILHIGFSSGISSSYNNAAMCGRELQEEYPDSKIIVIDLKYAKEEEVEVRKIGNDLEVSYLNYKRRFKLADNISSRKISSFSLQDNKLRVVMDYD